MYSFRRVLQRPAADNKNNEGAGGAGGGHPETVKEDLRAGEGNLTVTSEHSPQPEQPEGGYLYRLQKKLQNNQQQQRSQQVPQHQQVQVPGEQQKLDRSALHDLTDPRSLSPPSPPSTSTLRSPSSPPSLPYAIPNADRRSRRSAELVDMAERNSDDPLSSPYFRRAFHNKNPGFESFVW